VGKYRIRLECWVVVANSRKQDKMWDSWIGAKVKTGIVEIVCRGESKIGEVSR